MDRFRTAFVCEQAGDERDWGAPTGYLSPTMLKSIVPDFAQREIFCCGPEPYMAAVRTMLKEADFDMTHYHEESFSFERHAPASEGAATKPAPPDAPAKGFKIEFTRLGRVIECGPDQFILDAARAVGMRLPFSCSKGMCGTCKTKKLVGNVAMNHAGGIRQREIDAGMILICCSKPLSDVVLEK
jgi:ferredoxin